jgi:hypothetical protein
MTEEEAEPRERDSEEGNYRADLLPAGAQRRTPFSAFSRNMR